MGKVKDIEGRSSIYQSLIISATTIVEEEIRLTYNRVIRIEKMFAFLGYINTSRSQNLK